MCRDWWSFLAGEKMLHVCQVADRNEWVHGKRMKQGSGEEKKRNTEKKRRNESDKQTCQKEDKLGPLFYFSSSAKVFMLKANQSAKQRCGQAIFFPSVLLITRLLTIRFFLSFRSFFFVLLKHFILFLLRHVYFISLLFVAFSFVSSSSLFGH